MTMPTLGIDSTPVAANSVCRDPKIDRIGSILCNPKSPCMGKNHRKVIFNERYYQDEFVALVHCLSPSFAVAPSLHQGILSSEIPNSRRHPLMARLINSSAELFPNSSEWSDIMLNWALTFFIIAIIAAILGFGGVAGEAAWIAHVLFVVFLVLFLVSLVAGRRAPPV